MLKRVGLVALLVSIVPVAANASTIIDIQLVPGPGPYNAGDAVPVEVFVSSDGPLPDLRLLQFDLTSNISGADSGNILFDPNDAGAFVWDAGTFDSNFWFETPGGVPSNVYILPVRGPGAVDLDVAPIKVADLTVTYLADGFLDVTNPASGGGTDESARAQAGFSPPVNFSSFDGSITGGRVQIPEPATLCLLAAGTGALVLRRRRNRA